MVNYTSLSNVVLSKNQLIIDGFQVMQTWETNYMKMLADIVTQNGGHILEIGFGMGISAKFIQHRVKKHTIIESHPVIIDYAKSKFKKEIEEGQIKLIRDSWQDAVKKLKHASFDGILFDHFSSMNSPKNEELKFIKEAHRMLKKGGILTYYESKKNGLSRKKELQKIGFRKIICKIC